MTEQFLSHFSSHFLCLHMFEKIVRYVPPHTFYLLFKRLEDRFFAASTECSAGSDDHFIIVHVVVVGAFKIY
jgi:hypothetical protein